MYELSINSNYVSDWDVKSAIRELLQNGLDSAKDGHELKINYDEQNETLSIINEGARLDISKKQLTDKQRQLLLSLDKKWKYISKDEDGHVCLYEFEPYKGMSYFSEYIGTRCYIEDLFKKNMFDYLSWEDDKATLIEDLLK